MKRIVVVVVEEILYYPPTINLIKVLLDLKNRVTLVSRGIEKLDDELLCHPYFEYINLTFKENTSNLFSKIYSRKAEIKEVKAVITKVMKNADILWTCSIKTIRDLQKIVLNYKNVLQMMELYKEGYSSRITKFPLAEIARKSWKNVVPEENRAYIQKAWWQLGRLPDVLPNKPYSLTYGDITAEMEEALERMKHEKRKIILYLGGIFPDRNLESHAGVIQKMKDEYVLYIIGKAYDDISQKRLDALIRDYNVVYAGYFNPPKHLAFVEHSYIGLLSYRPLYGSRQSELNAMYCAPNKIFEYAGFGIPMIGSDVPGLKGPFEKWDMGVTCEDSNEKEFYKAIQTINGSYEKMSQNCKQFYNSVDLKFIISNIIGEKKK